MPHQTFKSVFISDLHIGSDITNYNALFKFLKEIKTQKLYLVGDIIQRNCENDDRRLIEFLNILDSRDFEVIYILGNHELSTGDGLPAPIKDRDFVKRIICKAKCGDILVEHGDGYDKKDKMLQFLKSIARKTQIRKEHNYQTIKKAIKRRLDKCLKTIAKNTLNGSFSKYMILKAKKNRCKAVICGHFHKPYTTAKYGIKYYNCGDWIDSCTYVAQSLDGKLELKRYR